MGFLGHDASNLKVLDCILRLFVIPLSVTSIWLSVTNQQDNSSYGRLEFSNLMGLKYMVGISAVSGGYALFTAISLWIRSLVSKAWFFFVSDQGTIRDAVEDSITWPVRKIIPILPGDYSDLELKPTGVLEVKLVQAKDLTNKDLIGKSDPFAELYVRPIRDRMKKSKTINNQLNPVWNEHFEFVVEDPLTQHLAVKIYDDEGLLSAELIGCAHIRLNELEPGKVKDVWLNLVKDLEIQRDTKNRGKVHL